jgi:ATP-dependent helicase/nuclease subunit A
LKEYAHKVGIRPDFRVIDAAEAHNLQTRILDDLLEVKYNEGGEGFLTLVDAYSVGRDDNMLMQSILDVHGKIQSLPYPDEWLNLRISEPLPTDGTDVGDTIWGRYLLNRAKYIVEYQIAQMETAIGVIKLDPKAKANYGDSCGETLGGLFSLSDAIDEGWDAAYNASEIPFPKLKSYRDPPAEISAAKELRDNCKKAVEKLNDNIFIAASSELLEDLSTLKPASDAFYRLIQSFTEEYDKEKLLRGQLDFSDLEHLAIKLLANPDSSEVAREVASRFDEILVDEFQDINGLQELIFNSLTDSGDVAFVAVGDIKQSIYRFRRADPKIFLKYYIGERSSEMDIIRLPHNFRSHPELLTKVNELFTNIMSVELGGLDYTEAEALKPGRDLDTFAAIDVPRFTLYTPAIEDGDPVEQEADFAAAKIKTLIDGGRQPGEIAVLLRATSDRAEVYVNSMRKLGIPSDSPKGADFFERPDVMAMMSVLETIDNPLQDIPLVTWLKLSGFSLDELTDIRVRDKTGDFYTALQKQSDNSEKCKAFLNALTELRALSADLSVDSLLQKIDEVTGLTDALKSVSPDAATMFFRILEYAKAFEANGYKGLFGFLTRLRELKDAGQSPVEALKISNEVTVTSIHSSKGLEYPVVIICDLSKKINRQDERIPLLMHEDFGVGPKFIEKKRSITYPTLPRLAIKAKLADETLSEEMRVLYVAMTRAKEQLIMICADRNGSDKIFRTIHPEELRKAQSCSDWILPVFAAISDLGEVEIEPLTIEPELVDNLDKPDLPDTYSLERFMPYIPSKLTATELKGIFQTSESGENAEELTANKPAGIYRRPNFVIESGGALTSSEKGTALHLVMQYLNYAKTSTEDELRGEAARLRENYTITRQQADSVDVRKILRFFRSPLGLTVLNSPKVHRELKFSMLVPAGELLGGTQTDKVLLQGVVDLCIEDESELTIIDYKTDYVTAATQTERAAFYKGQLDAYALALSRMFGKRVKARCIYFFATDEYVEFTQGEQNGA